MLSLQEGPWPREQGCVAQSGEDERGEGGGYGYKYGYALLQVVNRLVLKVDLLGAVDVGSIGENADGHAGAGDMGKPAQTQRDPGSQTLPG